jgi:hypothetical protein
MENKEIKLYQKSPFYFSFIAGLMIILALFSIIYINYGLKVKIISIIMLFFGIFIFLAFISTNIFRTTGYIITKESITFFSPLIKKTILWDQIVSYTVNGYEKNNDLYLRFYTGNSLKNKGKFNPKYELNISTKFCNININELIDKINKIRE